MVPGYRGICPIHTGIAERFSESMGCKKQVSIDNPDLHGKVPLLKIIVIGQFVPGHYSTITSKKRHTRLPRDCPFLHPTVGLARMVYETSDRAPGSIDDHVLIKVH